jgi:hypothetical protein
MVNWTVSVKPVSRVNVLAVPLLLTVMTPPFQPSPYESFMISVYWQVFDWALDVVERRVRTSNAERMRGMYRYIIITVRPVSASGRRVQR